MRMEYHWSVRVVLISRTPDGIALERDWRDSSLCFRLDFWNNRVGAFSSCRV